MLMYVIALFIASFFIACRLAGYELEKTIAEDISGDKDPGHPSHVVVAGIWPHI